MLRATKSTDTVVVDIGDPEAAFGKAAYVSSATYFSPYQAHAPFGPNCAIADVGSDQALVLCSTQDIYASRKMLAALLGMPADRVRVQYYEGSGTFGHSCYEDAPQAAAVMSQAVGRPVRVQFMRWDELGWDNYGPAQLAEVRAAIDADGRIIAYTYDGWQHGWHINETSTELAMQTPPAERSAGTLSIVVNRMSTGSMYLIPNRRVVSHAVPMVGLLKGSPLRSPLDMALSFASEQTIDELAHAVKMDPLDFRRKNMGDTRWLGVLNAAAQAAGWSPKVAASRLSDSEVVTGRGIAVGTHHVSYGAAVAEIEVNKRTGNIVAKHLYGALDCGLTVNPALVENQIVGMMIQATSRMLKEEVTFDSTGVTSVDWVSYPVLRFAEHPNCHAGRRSKNQRAFNGSRRRGDGRRGGGDCQCVLRCNRCQAHAIPFDAGARARRTRNEEGLTSISQWAGQLSTRFITSDNLRYRNKERSTKQIFDYFRRASVYALSFSGLMKFSSHAGPRRNDRGNLCERLDVRTHRQVFGCGKNLLSFLRQKKIHQQRGGIGMPRALGDDEGAGGAGDWRQQLRGHRRALCGADQRMVGENLQRDRIFAGNHAVDQCSRIAGAEIDDILRAQALQNMPSPFRRPRPAGDW